MTLAALVLSVSLVAGPPRIAVMDVEPGPGIDVKDRAILTDAFATALQDDAYRLLTMRDVLAMLNHERRQEILGCSDTSCLADVVGNLGTEAVAAVSLGHTGDAVVVSGRIVDARTATVVARANVAIGPGGILPALGKLGLELRTQYRRRRGLPPPAELLPPPPAPPAACETVAECDAACRRGDGIACAREGEMLSSGPTQDDARAAPAFERACELGQDAACARGAEALLTGGFVARAGALYQRACRSSSEGWQAACARAAELAFGSRGGPQDPEAGLTLARRACQAGVASSCDLVGLALARGQGTARDPSAASSFLVTGCTEGRQPACQGLAESIDQEAVAEPEVLRVLVEACRAAKAGTCLRTGAALERAGDAAAALDLYKLACLGGGPESGPSCEAAVRVMATRASGSEEQQAAFARQGCSAGVHSLCLTAALLEAGLPKPDLQRFEQLTREGCRERSDGARCHEAAVRLAVPSNPAATQAAIRLFEHNCELGHPESCRSAASYHALGRVVPLDLERARTLSGQALRGFEASCGQGRGEACLSAARYYELGSTLAGNVVATTPRRARELNELALDALVRECDGGQAEACRLAASFHFSGQVVPASVEGGLRYLEKACEKGLAAVCTQLAERFERGLGVEVDRARALRLHDLGCRAGGVASCRALGREL